MTEPDHRDEASRSEWQIRAMGPKLAEQAAALLRENTNADPVGLIAEPGTLEARRCRTGFEQTTGKPIPHRGAGLALFGDARPGTPIRGLHDQRVPGGREPDPAITMTAATIRFGCRHAIAALTRPASTRA